jgi:uncharacterized protein DUF6898
MSAVSDGIFILAVVMTNYGGQMPGRKQVSLDTVLFEFVRYGNSVKVSAIDPETGTEVAIVGDPRTGIETLKRIATRKLIYVMVKNIKGKQ